MNTKKTRSAATKPVHNKPLRTKRSQTLRRRRNIIIALIVLFIIAMAYVFWPKSTGDSEVVPQTTNSAPVNHSPTQAEQIKAAQSAAMPVGADAALNDTTTNSEGDINLENSDGQVPNPNTILNAPLPETDSLAKEEIDRLEDERKRFAEQEKLAAEQVAMNKKLTDMKAEQIELLEQQIAQLEADERAKVKAE